MSSDAASAAAAASASDAAASSAAASDVAITAEGASATALDPAIALRLGHAVRLVEKEKKFDEASDILGSLMQEWCVSVAS